MRANRKAGKSVCAIGVCVRVDKEGMRIENTCACRTSVCTWAVGACAGNNHGNNYRKLKLVSICNFVMNVFGSRELMLSAA